MGGNFVAPEGTPYQNRALPSGTKNKPYNLFEVTAPIDAWGGRTASWFSEPGGGYQYMFESGIEKLIEEGKLKIVDPSLISISGWIRGYTRRKEEDIIYDAVCR